MAKSIEEILAMPWGWARDAAILERLEELEACVRELERINDVRETQELERSEREPE